MDPCFLPSSPHYICPPFIVYLLIYILHHIRLYRICFEIVSFKNRIHFKMIKVIYGHVESKCAKGCIMRGSSCPTHNHLSAHLTEASTLNVFSFLCILLLFIGLSTLYIIYWFSIMIIYFSHFTSIPPFHPSNWVLFLVREIVFTLLWLFEIITFQSQSIMIAVKYFFWVNSCCFSPYFQLAFFLLCNIYSNILHYSNQ